MRGRQPGQQIDSRALSGTIGVSSRLRHRTDERANHPAEIRKQPFPLNLREVRTDNYDKKERCVGHFVIS